MQQPDQSLCDQPQNIPARQSRKLGNFELRILNFELLIKSRQENKKLQVCIADENVSVRG